MSERSERTGTTVVQIPRDARRVPRSSRRRRRRLVPPRALLGDFPAFSRFYALKKLRLHIDIAEVVS